MFRKTPKSVIIRNAGVSRDSTSRFRKSFDKGGFTYQFPYAMHYSDANKITHHPLPYASFPEFRQDR